jgi:hypothetical protein
MGTALGELIFTEFRNMAQGPTVAPARNLDKSEGSYEELPRRGIDSSLMERGPEHPESRAH